MGPVVTKNAFRFLGTSLSRSLSLSRALFRHSCTPTVLPPRHTAAGTPTSRVLQGRGPASPFDEKGDRPSLAAVFASASLYRRRGRGSFGSSPSPILSHSRSYRGSSWVFSSLYLSSTYLYIHWVSLRLVDGPPLSLLSLFRAHWTERGSVLRWPPYQIPNVLDTLGMYAAVTSERDVPYR